LNSSSAVTGGLVAIIISSRAVSERANMGGVRCRVSGGAEKGSDDVW
jgi:hypothetical protein